jgi:hypothetical protein
MVITFACYIAQMGFLRMQLAMGDVSEISNMLAEGKMQYANLKGEISPAEASALKKRLKVLSVLNFMLACLRVPLPRSHFQLFAGVYEVLGLWMFFCDLKGCREGSTGG